MIVSMPDFIIYYGSIQDEEDEGEYEYLFSTTLSDASERAVRESVKYNYKKYLDLIDEEACEYISEIEMYQARDIESVIEDILNFNYILTHVWRVLPETPQEAIKELFIDDPETFCDKYCIQEV